MASLWRPRVTSYKSSQRRQHLFQGLMAFNLLLGVVIVSQIRRRHRHAVQSTFTFNDSEEELRALNQSLADSVHAQRLRHAELKERRDRATALGVLEEHPDQEERVYNIDGRIKHVVYVKNTPHYYRLENVPAHAIKGGFIDAKTIDFYNQSAVKTDAEIPVHKVARFRVGDEQRGKKEASTDPNASCDCS